MTDEPTARDVAATCHCGAVTISLPNGPTEVTECNCNCTLCRRYGVLWAYYPVGEIVVSPDPLATDTYAWNGCNVDFHRCRECGCVTHWWPRKQKRPRRGINARLLPPEILASARIRHRDGAGTGKYLD